MMKKLFPVNPALLLAAAHLSAGDPVPVAIEDFARFAPGTYKMTDKTTWTIVEENGKHLLQTKPDTNLFSDWNYLDFRKNDLRLRIRFRMPYGNLILQTRQRNGELLTISGTEASFSRADGSKTVKNLNPGLITTDTWTTLEFVFRGDEIEAACLKEKGERHILLQVRQAEKGLVEPKLFFSKPVTVEWVKSFTIDGDLQELKKAHLE